MKLTHRRQDYGKHKIVIFIALISIILSVSPLSAQRIDNGAPSLKERLFYGGSLGLQFGGITDIQLSPVIGFWVLPRLAVALGPDYRGYKDHYGRTDIIGGSAYTQIVIIQDLNNLIPLGMHYGIFLQAEDELLSLESLYWKKLPVKSDRFFINTPMAGAGITQPLGKRTSLNMAVLWTLVTPEYDMYSNPEIRVSIIF
jgi:hypothetical protein